MLDSFTKPLLPETYIINFLLSSCNLLLPKPNICGQGQEPIPRVEYHKVLHSRAEFLQATSTQA
jgi:hypothetical protein